MTEPRLNDYLDHIRQAAEDACAFIDGLDHDAFIADKRTQQAVVMSLLIIGESASIWRRFGRRSRRRCRNC